MMFIRDQVGKTNGWTIRWRMIFRSRKINLSFDSRFHKYRPRPTDQKTMVRYNPLAVE